MDPLLDAILDSTKKEPKEEVEDDGMRETYGLASALVSAECSEHSNIKSSSEESETADVVNSQSDVVKERREDARRKRKNASKANQGRTNRHSETFACTECDYATPYAQVLQRHMRRHTGQKPHKCDLCEKRFALKKTNLTKHERTHFGQQFECPLCAMKLKSVESLRQQMELHTEQTFTCERCGHKANTKAVPDQHKRYGRCNKESTFKCDHCDFRTSTEFLLRPHLNRSSSTGRCRPPGKTATATYYTCPTCRFTTPSKQRYEKHILRRAEKPCTEPSRRRIIPSTPVMFMRAQRRFNFVDPKESDQAGPSNNKPAR
ncbi:zinc finger and BTB domain-containing protein 24 [Aphelenchoides avenae]|nr:zinc finger and BTB domain-containing protein 24 [Aphelenchus avenae]